MFGVVKDVDIEPMLKYLNSGQKNMKITFEEEKDGQINFLDMTVIKVGNKLKTKWYRKELCEGTMLNYMSNHRFKYKDNVVKIFLEKWSD